MENEIEINGKTYIVKEDAPSRGNLSYCIVRTYSAGVFAGWYDLFKLDKVGTVYDARRIWYWDGAASLSQLAKEGTTKPENCKFAMRADHYLTEIIEVLPATKLAQESIEGVDEWKQ